MVVAVELCAQLFTWNEQDCALVQEPQRVLDIFAEGDREIIKEFLLQVAAEQRKWVQAQRAELEKSFAIV